MLNGKIEQIQQSGLVKTFTISNLKLELNRMQPSIEVLNQENLNNMKNNQASAFYDSKQIKDY